MHATDEFFAPASALLSPLAPIHKPNTYVASGAWYDGWETRRHNPAPPDTATIALGVARGRVHGVEVDTAFFNGNHAALAGVEGGTFADDDAARAAATLPLSSSSSPSPSSPWETILAPQPCGPSARHAWLLPAPTRKTYTHVRLQMHPDGGIARFRLYGRAEPSFSSATTSTDEDLDLAAAQNGGRAVAWSDQRFGRAANLLLPGRGADMGDGWETARSRGGGHRDWAVVRLGVPGRVRRVVVDTAFFRGNFPQSVRVEGWRWPAGPGQAEPTGAEAPWAELVAAHPCRPDAEHVFEGAGLAPAARDGVWTHVRLVMIPDGGVKRLRVFGRREV